MVGILSHTFKSLPRKVLISNSCSGLLEVHIIICSLQILLRDSACEEETCKFNGQLLKSHTLYKGFANMIPGSVFSVLIFFFNSGLNKLNNTAVL